MRFRLTPSIAIIPEASCLRLPLPLTDVQRFSYVFQLAFLSSTRTFAQVTVGSRVSPLCTVVWMEVAAPMYR